MQHSKIGRSHVEFGELDKYYVRGDDLSKIKYMGAQNDFFWAFYTWGFGFGELPEGPDSYKLPEQGGVYGIFDTGSSHIFVPNNLWEVFINKMIEKSGAEVAIKDGYAVTKCDAQWLPIWPIIYEEGYKLEI